MLLWNRREVYRTASMQALACARDALDAAGVRHEVKTAGRGVSGASGDGRMRASPPGRDPQAGYQYFVYVHKRDFERARGALHGKTV